MRYLIFAILFSLGASTASAQDVYSSSGKTQAQLKREAQRKRDEKKGKFDASRMIYGGGFGLSVGQVTSIAVSPIVGYRITNGFSAGLGLSYQFIKIKEYIVLFDPSTASNVVKPLTANVYAPSLWARHMIWNNVFAHAEYQHNFTNISTYTKDFYQSPSPIIKDNFKVNQPSLWLGGGIKAPMSDKVSFIVMGLYNVLEDKYGLYNGRLDIRLGINAGF